MRVPVGYDAAGQLVWGFEQPEPPYDFASESADALRFAPWPEQPDPSEVLNTYTPRPPTSERDET